MAKSAFLGDSGLYLDGVYCGIAAGTGSNEACAGGVRAIARHLGVPLPDVSALEAEIERLRDEARDLRGQRKQAERERDRSREDARHWHNEADAVRADRDRLLALVDDLPRRLVQAEGRAARAEAVVEAAGRPECCGGWLRDLATACRETPPRRWPAAAPGFAWLDEIGDAVDAYAAGAPAPAEPSLEDTVVEAAVAWIDAYRHADADDYHTTKMALIDAVDALLAAREPEPAKAPCSIAAYS